PRCQSRGHDPAHMAPGWLTDGGSPARVLRRLLAALPVLAGAPGVVARLAARAGLVPLRGVRILWGALLRLAPLLTLLRRGRRGGLTAPLLARLARLALLARLARLALRGTVGGVGAVGAGHRRRGALVPAGAAHAEHARRQPHEEQEPDDEHGHDHDHPREAAGVGADVHALRHLVDVGEGHGVAVDLAAAGLDDRAGEGEGHPEVEVEVAHRGAEVCGHPLVALDGQVVFAVLLGEVEAGAEVVAGHHARDDAAELAVLLVGVDVGRHLAHHAHLVLHVGAHGVRGAVLPRHELLVEGDVVGDVDGVDVLDVEIGVELPAAGQHQEEGQEEDGGEPAPYRDAVHEAPRRWSAGKVDITRVADISLSLPARPRERGGENSPSPRPRPGTGPRRGPSPEHPGGAYFQNMSMPPPTMSTPKPTARFQSPMGSGS